MKRNHLFCILGLSLALLAGCAAKQDDAASPVGVSEARQIALADAGLTAAEVETITAGLDSGSGSDRYQVTFTAGGKNYTYEIDALTGAVIKAHSSVTVQEEEPSAVPTDNMDNTDQPSEPSPETRPSEQDSDTVPGGTGSAAAKPPAPQTGSAAAQNPAPQTGSTAAQNPNPAPGIISADDARAKALAHAGLTGSQVIFTKSELDYEDGRQVYEVEFYTSDYAHEYDYEIDASTGAVISYDHDTEHRGSHHGSANQGGTVQNGTITAEKAKEIALAKVPGATAGNIREFETDYDDGRMEYEGEIIYDGMEYEFEIDASTGSILKWESEPVGH